MNILMSQFADFFPDRILFLMESLPDEEEFAVFGEGPDFVVDH